MMEALAGGMPLSARARRVARSREEMLSLLADFSDCDDGDSDRELSLSDLVVVEPVRPNAGHVSTAPQPAALLKDHGHGSGEAAEQRKEQEEPAAAAAASSKQQREAAVVAGRERRLRRRGSDGRGSCGGGADGVLLNFYVPGLLTRSMTAPRAGRGALPPGAAHGAPSVTSAAGKSRIQAPLAVGCWPALWGRGRDRRSKPV